MWKFRYVSQFVPKTFNFRTITLLADGSGKSINKTLCSAIKFNFDNPKSPVPYSELNKMNFKNYQFPIVKISYDQEDVVEYAKSSKCKLPMQFLHYMQRIRFTVPFFYSIKLESSMKKNTLICI